MQKKHLYNTKLGKVRWFVERFGARELLGKPFRVAFAPLIISTLPARKFSFKGKELDLFYHRYNMTWASERCVEVPVARDFAQRFEPGKTLEVGNVLYHYSPVNHDILDKFERAPGVINEDITSFRPDKQYDLVFSISTFEHIGFDDETEGSSAEKIMESIQVCRGLLTDRGLFVMTVPIGYNPELDDAIRSGRLGTRTETYLKKYGRLDWRECSKAEGMSCKYRSPFPYANAVLVAEFGASAGR